MTGKRRESGYVDCADAIIEGSLEFLQNEDMYCLNELVYSGGLEHVTPKNLLPYIWKVNEEVANQCTELLYSCGLIQYTEKLWLTEMTYSLIPFVEIHALIVQHLFMKMDKTALSFD